MATRPRRPRARDQPQAPLPAAARLSGLVVEHFRRAGRALPWRDTRDPYAIWVSEIMLQQTRVATVIPYFERWMARFPTLGALAGAPLDDVLAAWSGLGYYSRARNLHRGARHVLEHLGGALPAAAPDLCELPGIGPYTAGAIASIAFGQREPVVDGNVMRVLARLHAIEDDIKSAAVQRRLWALARALVPADAPGDFNQGLMELGATVCTPTRPGCPSCPVRDHCLAHAQGRQHELPRRPARRPAHELPLIDARALWITRDEHILLVRRIPSGLYGGLWELPQTEAPDELETLIPGARLRSAAPLADHEQILTHRRLRVRVFSATLPAITEAILGTGARARYDSLTWQPRDAPMKRGLSSATRVILRQVLEMHPWSSTKRPSPSSRRDTARSSKASRSSATTPATSTSRARRAARPKGSTR